MKIAYFINQYPKTSHSFIRREIQAVERQGISVERLALRGWDEPVPDDEDRKERSRTRYVLQAGLSGLMVAMLAELLRSPMRFLSTLWLAVQMSRRSDRPLPMHLIYFAEACQVARWSRATHTRHIHAHFGTNSTEVAMLAAGLGGPSYSFTAHGPEEFMLPMGIEEKVHRSRFAVAVSSFGRSQLYLRCDRRDWPRVQIVHCGLEAEYYDAPWSPCTHPTRLICVGRLCAAKGQLLLVEAAARLIARGQRLELVLAGDGPMRPQIERLIEERGVGACVRITGWLSGQDIRAEILAARALVLPSFAEGLPVVIMEAMALRRPVLSTYVAGIPELVQSGETGWLVAAGSVDELMRAVTECLRTPDAELRRLGENGRRRIIESHAIDREAAKLAALFRRVTSAEYPAAALPAVEVSA